MEDMLFEPTGNHVTMRFTSESPSAGIASACSGNDYDLEELVRQCGRLLNAERTANQVTRRPISCSPPIAARRDDTPSFR